MDKYEFEWEQNLKTSPIQRNTSPDVIVLQIKQRLAREKRRKSVRIAGTVGTLAIALGIFLIQTNIIHFNPQSVRGNSATQPFATQSTPEENKNTGSISIIDGNEVVAEGQKSQEGLQYIKASIPFQLKMPERLKVEHLRSVSMISPDPKNNKIKNVDLRYQIEDGEIHIWQTNEQNPPKDPFNIPGVKYKKVTINNQVWYYNKKEDTDLHIFTTQIDSIIVQLSGTGTLPHEEMVSILESVK